MTEGTHDQPAAERGPEAAAAPPFGPAFFASVLHDRVAAICEGQPEETPVVLLRLADGTVLDLCHVTALTPQYVVATVYRDPDTCDDMDLVLAPYQLVTWVKIGLHNRTSRPIGFELMATAGTAGQ